MAQMVVAKLLIVKTGDAIGPVIAHQGDFDRLFTRPLDGLPVEAITVPVHMGAGPLPDPSTIDGAIITGSRHSVTEREPWADALAAWVRSAHQAALPILGVCYGHQLLAHALGGRVTRNPSGYEIGTVRIDLTEAGLADPLLGALAPGERSLRFNAIHEDAVAELPEGATVLATNAATAVQAFAVGPNILAVQFHPEFDEGVMRLYLVHAEAQAELQATPLGPALIRRFVERFIQKD